MVDIKNRRHFLKKIRPTEDVKPELLYVGSTITVYSRQLKIIDYGDDYTRSRMEAKSERCAQTCAWGRCTACAACQGTCSTPEQQAWQPC